MQMKDVKFSRTIQIDITNKCEKSCSNCTHLVRHVKTWEMNYSDFKKAVDSLVDFPGMIGIIGGNPTLHSQFVRFTKYLVLRVPQKDRRGLWTSGGPSYKINKDFIYRSYGFINYNDHNKASYHQPILINPRDVIRDKAARNNYIDKCWLAEKWSPSITPKGCYRCEVMGSFDMLLNKNLGIPIKKNWWKMPLINFSKQVDNFCINCSIPIPLRSRFDYEGIDDISKTNLKIFKRSLRIKDYKYKLSTNQLLLTDSHLWKKENYRSKKNFFEIFIKVFLKKLRKFFYGISLNS